MPKLLRCWHISTACAQREPASVHASRSPTLWASPTRGYRSGPGQAPTSIRRPPSHTRSAQPSGNTRNRRAHPERPSHVQATTAATIGEGANSRNTESPCVPAPLTRGAGIGRASKGTDMPMSITHDSEVRSEAVRSASRSARPGVVAPLLRRLCERAHGGRAAPALDENQRHAAWPQALPLRRHCDHVRVEDVAAAPGALQKCPPASRQ